MNYIRALQIFLILQFAIFLSLNTAFGKNYYIDAIKGNDSNSGLSTSLAWKSTNAINTHSFIPGDIISFASGQVFGNCKIYMRSVYNRHRLDGVTFNSFGTGAKPIIKCVVSNPGISLDYQNNVHFSNLEFTRDSLSRSGFLSFNLCNGLIIDNCIFDGKSISSIQLVWIGENTSTSIVRNSIFKNGGKAYSRGAHGLYIAGHYFIIENNHFENFPDGEGLQVNANYTGTYESSSQITVRYNYFKGSKKGDIGWQSGDSSKIYGNVIVTVYKYESAIVFSHDGSVKNFGPKNSAIFNNTIIFSKDSSNTGIYLYGYPEINNITIKNNIFYMPDNGVNNYFIYQQTGGGTNLTINNNLFYKNKLERSWSIRGVFYYTFSNWQTAGYDKNGKWVNPLFKNFSGGDFSLQNKSPAINNGSSISGYLLDYLHNPVPTYKPDIGAFEHTYVTANLKVFLEGPYNTGSMSTTLSSMDLIPHSQPYNNNPWKYLGTESISKVPSNVVDWILVELRNNISDSTAVSRRAGFLLNNGNIVDLDGKTPLRFDFINGNKYFIIIKHRNHLEIMSALPVNLNSSSSLYDFTNAMSKAYGINPMFKLSDGNYAMFSGDGDANGGISGIDRNSIWEVENNSSGYLPGDFNLDGIVNSIDLNYFWRDNNGTVSQIPFY